MKSTALDATDIRILSVLQANGPLSKSKLAELVHLSPTPCWTRLDRLKAAGYVLGYHSQIALGKIGTFTQVVVTVSLTEHRKADFNRFETYIQKLDEVVECIATGGGTDYVMKVFTSDLAAFQALMDQMLASELGILRYMTYIVTREVKASVPNLSKLFAGQGD